MSARGARDLQESPRPDGVGGKCLEGEAIVVDRAGRRRKVEDHVHLHQRRSRHVRLDEGEARVAGQAGDVLARTGHQVVQAGDGVSVGDQAIAHVAPDEAGPPGNQDLQ